MLTEINNIFGFYVTDTGILKQLFTSASVKVVAIIYLHFSEQLNRTHFNAIVDKV